VRRSATIRGMTDVALGEDPDFAAVVHILNTMGITLTVRRLARPGTNRKAKPKSKARPDAA
jgi:hypothetical protein